MKEYLPIIKARSGLFRGIEESELEKLFGCLEARKQTYRKEEYILREGEQTKVLGLVLSGSVLIVQDDVWGGRNVLSVLGPGQCFAVIAARMKHIRRWMQTRHRGVCFSAEMPCATIRCCAVSVRNYSEEKPV